MEPGRYLVYFTRTDPPCRGCLVVKPWVEALQHQGYAIVSVDWSTHPELFAMAGVEVVPKFVLVDIGENGFPTIRQRVEGTVTPQRLAALAPFASTNRTGSTHVEIPTPNGGVIAVPRDGRNVLPVPAPPIVDTRRDVPDVEKTDRIRRLEEDSQAKLTRLERLDGQLNALGARVTSLEASLERIERLVQSLELAVSTLAASGDSESGVDLGALEKSLTDVRRLAELPIVVVVRSVAEDGSETQIAKETYPRGTPIVLRFDESILKREE